MPEKLDKTEIMADDIPMTSFIKKGRSTSDVLGMCVKENERRIKRDLIKINANNNKP